MSWIAAGIAGGSALLKFGQGLSQKSQANSIDRQNLRPVYTPQAEYQQNVNTAQQMAQTGIPQAAYNNQLNNINQNQASALSVLSRSANPGASLASIVRSGNEATGQLNAQDAMVRNQNLLNLLQQRQTLAQQKEKSWDWNSQQKYLELLAKSNALRGAGMQNIGGALGDMSSLGTSVMDAQHPVQY